MEWRCKFQGLKMIVGVTGGVGSGKTTFVRFLKQLGAETVDVDALARDLIDGSETIQAALRSQFGGMIFTSDDVLDRAKLGRTVFSDRVQLEALNQIVWPELLEELRLKIAHYRKMKPHRLVVFDMAILVESDSMQFFDEVLVIVAPREARVQRLMKSHGWDREMIQNRMQSQMSDEEKIRFADSVIHNQRDINTLEDKARCFLAEHDRH